MSQTTSSNTGDVVVVKPTSNVYTVLAFVALVAQIIGLTLLYIRFDTVFDVAAEHAKGLFGV
jgi:hypothetical protein